NPNSVLPENPGCRAPQNAPEVFYGHLSRSFLDAGCTGTLEIDPPLLAQSVHKHLAPTQAISARWRIPSGHSETSNTTASDRCGRGREPSDSAPRPRSRWRTYR